MPIELLVVLATSKAPDWSSWNQALWAAHVPASLARSVDLQRHNGFLPVRVQGRATGFYFMVESASDLALQYPALASVPLSKPIVYSLSYGRPEECAAAFLSASVLVSRFQGVVFDPQQGLMLSLDQVNDGARQCLNLVSR
ncbi:MAG TPA: hypothetical protein VLV25_04145 [Steroidobacteraceae bacterium]|jgi:hypothetical protein|nr:hypothetical protein [Steroidobacteraceae bacterium]